MFPTGFHYISNNLSLPGKILASGSVSFIPLGENWLLGQGNGSLLLSNIIQLVSNTPYS